MWDSTLLLLVEEAYQEKLRLAGGGQVVYVGSVSYTHLTLPTIYSV